MFKGINAIEFSKKFTSNEDCYKYLITIRTFTGHVRALNFRTTHIKTFDEEDVFIPNAVMIKEPLTNLTRDGKMRLNFEVGIAYEDDITGAIATILKAMELIPDIKQDKQAFAVVEELSVSTVNLRVYFWADTFDYKKGVLQIKSDVITKVKEALEAKGFSMPADIQEIKLYDKKEPLPINILNIKDVAKRMD